MAFKEHIFTINFYGIKVHLSRGKFSDFARLLSYDIVQFRVNILYVFALQFSNYCIVILP